MPKRKKQNNEDKDRLLFEKKALNSGYKTVAGLDEAGRGPLAGPVVAAAVVIQDEKFTERIDDSKKLTARMREKAFIEIMNRCDVGIGKVSVEDIDKINILNATLLAMKRAVSDLNKDPDYLLIDGRMNVELPLERTYLIRGEEHSLSIACASIVAKVFRDRIMIDEDHKYPRYGFKKHKGYGTAEHIKAIREYGFCDIHRKTFGPFGSKDQ